ncbi:MAG: hypothetical protein LJU34_00715 [Oscillospiraceae bacterium]|nr:hypothetical protein [Oscillospiraceae bacterium]
MKYHTYGPNGTHGIVVKGFENMTAKALGNHVHVVDFEYRCAGHIIHGIKALQRYADMAGLDYIDMHLDVYAPYYKQLWPMLHRRYRVTVEEYLYDRFVFIRLDW